MPPTVIQLKIEVNLTYAHYLYSKNLKVNLWTNIIFYLNIRSPYQKQKDDTALLLLELKKLVSEIK